MELKTIILSRGPRVELTRCNKAAHEFHRHIHTSLVMGVVLNGKRAIRINDHNHIVHAGECFIINPYQAHSCSPCSDGDVDYMVLSIAPDYIRTTLNNINDECYYRNVIRDKSLFEQFLLLANCFEKSSSWEKIVKEILIKLEPYLEIKKEAQSVKNRNQYAEQLGKYIESHFDEAIPASDLSRIVNKSPFHLNRTFREVMGIPPHNFLQLTRLRKARQMIQEGESIVQAALKSGFADQAHFTRLFKRNMGITPGKFIQR